MKTHPNSKPEPVKAFNYVVLPLSGEGYFVVKIVIFLLCFQKLSKKKVPPREFESLFTP